MDETGQSFIASARAYFTEDYLPKIERSLELLTDEQIWWRANPQSNSIGNLLLHLSGNVRQWIVCGIGAAADHRDRDAEFAQRNTIPRDELLGGLKQTLKEADAALAAIFHVVEHFSMQNMYASFLTATHFLFALCSGYSWCRHLLGIHNTIQP